MPTCTTVRLLPGPRGNTGTPGTDGTDGVNAYTVLTANFTMPAELGTAVATVADTSWMTSGNTYYLQGAGWLQATAIGGATSVTLMNLEDAASDAYLANVAPGTIIALSSKLVAAGIQGPAGTDGAGGAPTDATYILQTVDASLPNAQLLSGLATGLVKNTIGTGVLSIVDIGVTDGSIPLINDAGGLTNGEAVFGTAAGIETKTAANARTALGLGTMAVQNANNVNITGGTISGVSLGLTGIPKAMLLFNSQTAAAVGGGDFSSGAWRTVPISNEVVDTGGNGTLAANEITLSTGTYRAEWVVPAFAVDEFQSRLLNVTTASILGYGSSAVASSTDTTMDSSYGFARFAVAAATETIRIEAQCGLTNLGDGFGSPNAFGGTNVFAMIKLEKEEA